MLQILGLCPLQITEMFACNPFKNKRREQVNIQAWKYTATAQEAYKIIVVTNSHLYTPQAVGTVDEQYILYQMLEDKIHRLL